MTPFLAEDFYAISLDNFIMGEIAEHDIYLKLPNSVKAIKVLYKGESFLPEMPIRWKNQGLEFLYIKVEDYLRYSEKQSSYLSEIEKNTKLSYALKLRRSNEQAEGLIKSFVTFLDPIYLKNLEPYSKSVRQIILTHSSDEKNFPSNFVEAGLGKSHGLNNFMFSSLIAKHRGISSGPTFKCIFMGSVFHDIGLIENQNELTHEDYKKLAPEDLKEFEEHPVRSVEILSRFKEFDHSILQAIRQHHMRVRGKSFPEKSKSEIIVEASQIIGMSDEILNQVQNLGAGLNKATLPLLKSKLEEHVFPNFNTPIVLATKKALNI